MSFPRHEGIFRSDGRGSCRSGARSERLHAPTHRLDEFPTGYSSAGWSPPEPASASPAEQKFTMKAAPQPSLFQRMGKPCLAGCLTTGDAVNNLGPALERPLISLSGLSAKSATHLAARDSVDPVCSPSLAAAADTITRFCLLPLIVWLRRSACVASQGRCEL